jgi:hypothetical protein
MGGLQGSTFMCGATPASPRVDKDVRKTQRHAFMRWEVTERFSHAVLAGPEAAKDVAWGVGNARSAQ